MGPFEADQFVHLKRKAGRGTDASHIEAASFTGGTVGTPIESRGLSGIRY